MKTTLTTTNGETLTGRTIDSIIRREYGRKCYVIVSSDRNDPRFGLICREAIDRHHAVLGRIVSVDGWIERDGEFFEVHH